MDNTCPCCAARDVAQKAYESAEAKAAHHEADLIKARAELDKMQAQLDAQRALTDQHGLVARLQGENADLQSDATIWQGRYRTACMEIHDLKEANDELVKERDGRKAQQFKVETAIVSAYTEAFSTWAYESPEQAMRVFVRELQEGRASVETLHATWDNLHSAYSWTEDRLITTQSERDEARSELAALRLRLLRALGTLRGRGERRVNTLHAALLLAIDAIGSDMRYVTAETEKFILTTAGLPYPTRVEGSSDAAIALLRQLRDRPLEDQRIIAATLDASARAGGDTNGEHAT